MTTSFTTLQSSRHTVSFPVNEVEPAKRLLKEIKYQQAVEIHLGKVEAGSVKGKSLVEWISRNFSRSENHGDTSRNRLSYRW